MPVSQENDISGVKKTETLDVNESDTMNKIISVNWQADVYIRVIFFTFCITDSGKNIDITKDYHQGFMWRQMSEAQCRML